jgi:hypothetical protein
MATLRLPHNRHFGNGPDIVRRRGFLGDRSEDAQIGGAATITVNDVAMRQVEVSAIGDFFASPEQMQSATPDELTRLRGLIRRDRDAAPDQRAHAESGVRG